MQEDLSLSLSLSRESLPLLSRSSFVSFFFFFLRSVEAANLSFRLSILFTRLSLSLSLSLAIFPLLSSRRHAYRISLNLNSTQLKVSVDRLLLEVAHICIAAPRSSRWPRFSLSLSLSLFYLVVCQTSAADRDVCVRGIVSSIDLPVRSFESLNVNLRTSSVRLILRAFSSSRSRLDENFINAETTLTSDDYCYRGICNATMVDCGCLSILSFNLTNFIV